MNLDLSIYYNLIASQYKSSSQIARIITEKWTSDNLYCPRCGRRLAQYPNNKPVYDFYCEHLNGEFIVAPRENFQLKSTKKFPNGHFSDKILGAEYKKEMRIMEQDSFPSLILLHYEEKTMTVKDVLLIHRLAITPSCIKPRLPLPSTAKRSAWQGSIIDLDVIPELGRITVINNSNVVSKDIVQNQWNTVESLLKGDITQRSWTSDILNCIYRLPSRFNLDNVYRYENELAILHPQNNHIKDKIRQQLQILRDRGFIYFVGNGEYKKKR